MLPLLTNLLPAFIVRFEELIPLRTLQLWLHFCFTDSHGVFFAFPGMANTLKHTDIAGANSTL